MNHRQRIDITSTRGTEAAGWETSECGWENPMFSFRNVDSEMIRIAQKKKICNSRQML